MCAFDVVVIDNRRQCDHESTKAKRRHHTRIMAKIADRRKRVKTNGNGRTMQDRLRDHNIIFTPLAFEIGCAESGAWSKTLKKLSEIAHARRGHNIDYFKLWWNTEMAMCIAKRGAQAALRNAARSIAAANAVLDIDEGAFGDIAAEIPILAGGG